MAESVFVLYRSSLHHCLILGVFSSDLAARDYVDRMQVAPIDAWRPGRPGTGRWDLVAKDYHYIIEEHTIRHSGGPPTRDELRHERWSSPGEPDKPDQTPSL